MADLIDRDAIAYKVKSCITIPADNEWDSGYNYLAAPVKSQNLLVMGEGV